MVNRASSSGYRQWWRAVAGTGFCSNPIHLHRRHGLIGEDRLMLRCGNRRAAVCPPCSRLYGGDTWQLVHAGILGGHHGIPTTVAEHPMAFVTLTAPSYGRVHPAGPSAGHPLDPARYDYPGHVLFSWWAPELWRRYTIRIRRLLTRMLRERGQDPNQIRLTFLKVCENQARLIPHFHAVLRLDTNTQCAGDDSGEDTPAPPAGVDVSSADLAAIALRAAAETSLVVADPTSKTGDRVMMFGAQVDARPLDPSLPLAVRKKIAGYLAKYVTKSVTDHGVTARRVSPQITHDRTVLAGLSEHARSIIGALSALAEAAPEQYSAMLRWLHTLGYRGHVTTKSRRYSLTMGALRAARALWRQHHPTDPDNHPENTTGDGAGDRDDDATTAETAEWTYVRSGHDTRGDHQLTTAAAKAHLEQLWARRESELEARAAAP